MDKSTRRRRVHRKHTSRKDHRRQVHYKHTMRQRRQQRGGHLSDMIGQLKNPEDWSHWVAEMRSAFSHGVLTVASLDKAMTHVINSKIYFQTAAKNSPDMKVTNEDAAVMQLLEEADTEITGTRQAVADVSRQMGDMLKNVSSANAADYQKTMDDKLGRPSRIDTTTPKGTWIKELNVAYNSVVVATSEIKNRAIPYIIQAKDDFDKAFLAVGWNPELAQKVQDTKTNDITRMGIRDLKDAYERLSIVAIKMASELKKHNIKDFAKTHDYNLRHYLK